MKIQMNTIYHLPTQQLEDDFLRQADKQGITWRSGLKASERNDRGNFYNGEYCIHVEEDRLTYSNKRFYENDDELKNLPIIKWELEPKFKVGDKVKYVSSYGNTTTPFFGTITKRHVAYSTNSVDGYQYNIMDEHGHIERGWAQEMELDERSEKMESKFKVGDTVKITKANISFDRPFVGRVAKIVETFADDTYYLHGIGLRMCENQLELAEEPKFQIGDKVKYVPRGTENPTPFYGTVVKRYANVGCTNSADGYQYDIMDANGKLEWGWAQEMELDERSEKMESKFKVGDLVKVTKEIASFDRKHIGKVAKIAEVDMDGDYILEGISLVMLEDQLELAEEPKPTPKYKVGDVVKIKDNPPANGWVSRMDCYKDRTVTIKSIRDDGRYEMVAPEVYCGYWVINEEDIECLASEVKLDFKVGDKVVFARESTGEFSAWNKAHTIGEAYGVINISTDKLKLRVDSGYWMPKECFDLAPETKPEPKSLYHTHVMGEWGKPEPKSEPKYPQIEDFVGNKVVFNPPYTIVTRNLTCGPDKGKQLIGKAKCNSEDVYDKWTGFKIAHERMRVSKPCSK